MTVQAARTSLTHPILIATLQVGDGKIGITFCPGKKQSDAMTGVWDRDLRMDLETIREWGACDVVSLIESHEMTSLCVDGLPHIAKEIGLRWHHLPIVDQCAPDHSFERMWRTTRPSLVSTLHAGGGVLVHCKGGLGRAGTVAAMLLLDCETASTAADAIARVREVRPGAIETYQQELYLNTWASQRRDPP